VCAREGLRLGLTISLNLSVSLTQMSQLLDKAKNFVAEKLANIEKPEACIDDVDFKRLSRDSVEYLAKVSVKNPYGHALPICEISYTLKSAGRFHLISYILLFGFRFLFVIDRKTMQTCERAQKNI